ncbi:MAG: hypothetical protein JHC70_02850 [Rhodococcus sp.]|uniref:hypothetical protein n=1 Tax=Nocardiaceae TaxID=85025 RepID=UPI001A3154C5|nr:hypothetical protein [Rhodococcus sp. (in: high G+C Gram-positive bacteria)]MBJ7321265.1 hypothetical protein [Rhodococcus sp. (in: high G+C Gram-positive bacteria)]
MNATTRAILSPVVGAVVALAIIWGVGGDIPLWRAASMVLVGAGVVFALNFAWESNPWTENPTSDEHEEVTAR